MSPRKVRRVVDMVRGKSVDEALTILKYVPQIAAEPVSKVIASAAANAENNLDLTRDDLYIAQAFVDAGPSLKRVLPRMRGMADRVLKRTSHITVVVREREG
jgi:large subunit ribosomal protein L22